MVDHWWFLEGRRGIELKILSSLLFDIWQKKAGMEKEFDT
jgi:hypothetical protein